MQKHTAEEIMRDLDLINALSEQRKSIDEQIKLLCYTTRKKLESIHSPAPKRGKDKVYSEQADKVLANRLKGIKVVNA